MVAASLTRPRVVDHLLRTLQTPAKLQAEEHRRQAAAVRAKAIDNEANQRKAAALRQRLRLVLS
jgi:hypothetical protein